MCTTLPTPDNTPVQQQKTSPTPAVISLDQVMKRLSATPAVASQMVATAAANAACPQCAANSECAAHLSATVDPGASSILASLRADATAPDESSFRNRPVPHLHMSVSVPATTSDSTVPASPANFTVGSSGVLDGSIPSFSVDLDPTQDAVHQQQQAAVASHPLRAFRQSFAASTILAFPPGYVPDADVVAHDITVEHIPEETESGVVAESVSVSVQGK
jgi:hypothetical protein